MERYSGLLKSRNKALNIFQEAKQKMLRVIGQMNAALEESKENQTQLELNLKDEKDAQSYLDVEIKRSMETVSKISEIVG